MTTERHSVTIHRRLRPIRLAFLVRPNDRKALRAVLEINTCLWGGRFNGIIPALRRTPSWWEEDRIGGPSSGDIVRGYLDTFEPDYVVTSKPGLAAGLDLEAGRLLDLEDILSAKRDEPIAYGVPVGDLYRELYRKEFQFVRKHPVEVVHPRAADGRFALFVAVCFGTFPSTASLDYLRQGFRDAFDAKDLAIDGTNLLQVFLSGAGTPFRMGSAELEVNPHGWPPEPTLFFMDATQPRDLVDYWNLRALGWRILPVPRQWSDHLAAPCRRFVESNDVPYRANPELRQSTTLLKSRSVPKDVWEAFAAGIRGPERRALTLQEWYPRIWDEWTRNQGHVTRCHVSADEGESAGSIEEDRRVAFATLSPRFAERYGGTGAPRWVNVVQVKDYRRGSEMGVVLPPGLRNLDRLLETVHREATSAASEGIVTRCEYHNWREDWRLPDHLTVFRTWLSSRGLSADLSDKGRITLELVRSLGGLTGVATLANVEILKLLDKMAHGLVESPGIGDDDDSGKPPVRGRMVPRRAWLDLLRRINGDDGERAKGQLELLTRRGVLRVGLRLKCSVCAQANWYATEEIADELRCERCLRTFAFPAADPPVEAWNYRTQGPFSMENYAQGGYAVALALRFLTTSLHAQATWVPNLEMRDKAGTRLEVDCALWWKGRMFSGGEPTLILGECKSFGPFEAKDVRRAKALAERFPGATLVFATLRTELDAKEVARLAALARAGRRHLKAEKWRAPVLVLTAYELMHAFGPLGPPYCWRDAGGKFAAFASQYRGVGGLQELCDATQQLHLSMESYHEWLRQYFERRHRRRARSAEKRTPNA